MNIIELSETEIVKLKNTLKENGNLFETNRIKNYDAKFFEAVTITKTIMKYLLFISIGLYVLIIIFGNFLSFIFNSFNLVKLFASIIVIFFVCFISFAIFNNINTDKKREENILYIKEDYFIFNFSNGVVATPKLFYSLPYESIQSIEFLIHGVRKKQLFGSVIFVFNVLGYEVKHSIISANLTEINLVIKNNFPALLNKIMIDGKGKKQADAKEKHKLYKSIALSLAALSTSALLAMLLIIFNFYSLSLILSSVILIVISILVFISHYIYAYHLIQEIIISSVFMFIGYIVPLIIIESSNTSFLLFLAQNNLILLPTFFGNLGLCLCVFIIVIFLVKLNYKLKSRKYNFDLK